MVRRVGPGPEGTSLRRAVAVGVALLVVLGAGYATWRVLLPLRPGPGGREGYLLLLPRAASPPPKRSEGGAVLRVATNLPEGTLAVVEAIQVGGAAAGARQDRCCPPVEGGTITVRLENRDCLLAPVVAEPSRGFRVRVVVAPDVGLLRPDCPDHAGCSLPQPEGVRAVLGPGFERVAGDQVTRVAGMRALVAEGTFDWPEDTCVPALAAPERLPARCRPAGERIAAVGAEGALEEVVGALTGLRGCDLWGWGSADFRAARPWRAFRAEVLAWLERLPPAGARPPGGAVLSSSVVEESDEVVPGYAGALLPLRVVGQVLRAGTPVAEVELGLVVEGVPTVVPRWEVARLDLLPPRGSARA